jgi:hypothetical protein
MNDTDIPLTTVQSHNSSIGARRTLTHPSQLGGSSTFRTQQSRGLDDEKKGLFKRRGGRRKVKKITSRVNTDGEEVKVNGLGRFYNKIVNFSVVTRYLVYVLPIALLLAVPIVIYAVLKPGAFFASTGVRVYLFWTW